MIFLKKTLIGMVIFLIIIFCLFSAGFRWNESVSYPKGLYQVTESTRLERGDLVLFCPPNIEILKVAMKRQYLRFGMCQGGFEPVIKRIVGMGGDHVSFSDVVNINNQRLPKTHRFAEDGQHRPLPQIADFILPPETFFVISDHAPTYSFDSRYYGAIPKKNVIGVIKPIYLI